MSYDITHEAIEGYIRRRTYVYTNYLQHSFECSIWCDEHTQENPLCADVLTMRMWKLSDSSISTETMGNGYAITHSGRYCALMHASCEVLCETLSHTPVKQHSTIVNTVFDEHGVIVENNADFLTDTASLEIPAVFWNLYNRPLSPRRRMCLVLPFIIMSTIIHRNIK